MPALITTVTPQRIGGDVYLTFTVPDSNSDQQKPASIAAVEMYAVTSAIPPATEEQRQLARLIATVPVHPILPEPPVPANGSAPPPIPLPPGVDQGAVVSVKEALTAETRTAIELPVEKALQRSDVIDSGNERIGPLVSPAPIELPRRHYFAVAVNPRGRKGMPSTAVSIPLESGSSAPGDPLTTIQAPGELTIKWTPAPDARTATIAPPPSVKPTVGANATPSNVTPTRPLLTAKSLGFSTVATTYNIYDVTPSPADAPPPDPFAIAPPKPLNAQPLPEPELVIKGVAYGVERCFEARPVDQVFGATVIGPASPKFCITPADTFPPAAPRSLQAIAGPGVINLIWDANTESDLAGYIVLRGEAPGDTLQAITTAPVTGTTYRDETVKPGTRYVYAVVAVDRATPQNVSPQSNRAEETARQ